MTQQEQDTSIGVPMNVYDYLDKKTLAELQDQLDADVDLASFSSWLDEAVAAGSLRPIVADHIAQWNRLKHATRSYLAEYDTYSSSRLHEWKPSGLDQPSSAMFESSRSATPPKQARNEPCNCGSGRKYKRCHGDWS